MFFLETICQSVRKPNASCRASVRGVRGVVGGQADFEVEPVVEDFVATLKLEVAEFFHRIGGVGDQLADENLAVGVEGVDDDVQQLPDFCLKRLGGVTHG